MNKHIVRLLSNKTKCPILELSYHKISNTWFVLFDEYSMYNGKQKEIHIDNLLKELKDFCNIEYLTHECYEDSEVPNSFYEQVSFQWKE